jgi:FkbM family methyltransferase
VWSRYLADRYAAVYAVEANPALHEELTHLHPNVQLLPVGAWSRAERRTFTQFALDGNTSTAEGWTGIMAGPPVGSFEAECAPIDMLAREGRIKGRVAFLKIDVEAAEVEVLRGARITIEHDRPHAIIEVHSYGWMSQKLMEAWGYRVTLVRHPYYSEGDAWWDKHYWLVCEPA